MHAVAPIPCAVQHAAAMRRAARGVGRAIVASVSRALQDVGGPRKLCRRSASARAAWYAVGSSTLCATARRRRRLASDVADSPAPCALHLAHAAGCAVSCGAPLARTTAYLHWRRLAGMPLVAAGCEVHCKPPSLCLHALQDGSHVFCDAAPVAVHPVRACHIVGAPRGCRSFITGCVTTVLRDALRTAVRTSCGLRCRLPVARHAAISSVLQCAPARPTDGAAAPAGSTTGVPKYWHSCQQCSIRGDRR
ncbi:hypothetical protein BC834DRAFT_590762 [Gloeopeniophorella convolvens]|nr:hypothetical protein BC834DRAFT_590762 [Gloeopeniophorella convolvens]